MLIKVKVVDDRLTIYTTRFKICWRLAKPGRNRDTLKYDGKYVDVVFVDAEGHRLSQSELADHPGVVSFTIIKPRTWIGRAFQWVRTHLERQQLKEWEWQEETS